jgi:exonuclease III
MTEPAAKRIKSLSCPSPTNVTSPSYPTRPSSIVTWNCNGFISRSLYNTEELKRLVQDTEEPDVFLFQEVRLKAHSTTQRGKPMASELEIVKPTLSTIFGNYVPYWSLSDSRYAGTLTLLHKRLGFHNNCREAAATTTTRKATTAFTPSSAIELLLKMYNVTRRDVGLSEQTISPKKKAVVQTSMTSFFSAKKASTTAVPVVAQEHNCEGRFQFILFPDMDLIQTYVPNNGTKEESFQRRRCWDQEVKEFLQARARIMEHLGNGHHRTLLWCGDMNCARDYRDGTHWVEPERNDTFGITTPCYYEWWTDESQCFIQPKPRLERAADDRGMPSFTPAERRRFASLLQTGNLVDVWRDLHPNGSTNRNDLAKWDRPDWTWRGHLGKNGNKSKYEGRGQRLDYFLLSPFSREAVEKCEILGYGGQREGLFCGSDHCASLLVMKTTWDRTKTRKEEC